MLWVLHFSLTMRGNRRQLIIIGNVGGKTDDPQDMLVPILYSYTRSIWYFVNTWFTFKSTNCTRKKWMKSKWLKTVHFQEQISEIFSSGMYLIDYRHCFDFLISKYPFACSLPIINQHMNLSEKNHSSFNSEKHFVNFSKILWLEYLSKASRDSFKGFLYLIYYVCICID